MLKIAINENTKRKTKTEKVEVLSRASVWFSFCKNMVVHNSGKVKKTKGFLALGSYTLINT